YTPLFRSSICNLEQDSLRQTSFVRKLCRGRNAILVRIDSGKQASRFPRNEQRGSAGSGADFKQMLFGIEFEPRKKMPIFVDGDPAVLTDIFAPCFLPHGVRNRLGEAAVGTVIKIDTLDHL